MTALDLTALRAKVAASASDGFRSMPKLEVALTLAELAKLPAGDVQTLLASLGLMKQRTKRASIASIDRFLTGTYRAYVANLV